MIKEALLVLNERNGLSPNAIAKYMEEKHKDNSAVRGKLIKIKASYKLSEMVKKEKVSTTTTKATKEHCFKNRIGPAGPTGSTGNWEPIRKPETVKKAVKKVMKKVGPNRMKKSTLAKPK
ncbi:hypothetical protein RGQ29_011786 [Quercus rubra]|uniref:H15 domain-containing protein n=1 Tax=Quercus rubra TaxID=3512 RepID=A0AAN7G8E5_QUERU|nr:hypothetical protein RGQ29_011786 [Quercus rubra]